MNTMVRDFTRVISVAALLCSISLPCCAHSINVFATAEGGTISGYAYSRGGGRIRQQPLVINSADGALLGETITDDNGEFTFAATQRIDHVIVLETADGHRATFIISADELPETLAGASAASTERASEPTAASLSPEPTIASENPINQEIGGAGISRDELAEILAAAVPSLSEDKIAELVETAVSRQIRPVREQLDAYESKIRLQNILGGIGYIIGLAGLASYFLGQKK